MFSFLNNKPLMYAIFLYIAILYLLIQTKMSIFYTPDGDMKQLGFGEGKTLFPLYLVAFIIAFMYFALSIILKR